MKWRLVIRPRAETDLREARNWYESQRPGLGAEFIAEIETAFQALVRHPQRYTIYYRGFRRVFVRRFPYKLFYRLEGDRVIYLAFSMRAAITLGSFYGRTQIEARLERATSAA